MSDLTTGVVIALAPGGPTGASTALTTTLPTRLRSHKDAGRPSGLSRIEALVLSTSLIGLQPLCLPSSLVGLLAPCLKAELSGFETYGLSPGLGASPVPGLSARLPGSPVPCCPTGLRSRRALNVSTALTCRELGLAHEYPESVLPG